MDPTTIDAKRRRALVADDSAAIREVLGYFLDGLGLEVSSVIDGASALDRLSHDTRFELLLLDVQMGSFGGIDVVRALEERRSPLLMSGEFKSRVTRIGSLCVRTLAKPFGIQEVVRLVAEIGVPPSPTLQFDDAASSNAFNARR